MEGFFVKGTRRFHVSSHIIGQVTLHKTGRCVQLYPNTLHGTNRNNKRITLLNLGKYCTMFHAKPSSLTVADFEFLFMHKFLHLATFCHMYFQSCYQPLFLHLLIIVQLLQVCNNMQGLSHATMTLHHGTLFFCPTYT